MNEQKVQIKKNNLACPKCNYEFIHHDLVEVIDRSEDSDGIFVEVMNEEVTVHAIEDEQISVTRRNYVRIRFSCESCEEVSFLYIIQHKGNTFIKWMKETYEELQKEYGEKE